MARDLNQVTIIGRLVRDPEIKYTANGTPVTKFSIANNMTFVQNNERKDYVNYFDVNVWGNQAVNCEKYLKKGSQVAVNGSLRQNRWNDKTTGQTRSKVEITANSVQFLTPSSGAGMGSNTNYSQNSQPNNMDNEMQQNNGFIEDPWNENANTNGAVNNNPYNNNVNNDDDIPF